MKQILPILLFILSGFAAQAQYPNENMVPNPSFEKYNNCPTGFNSIYYPQIAYSGDYSYFPTVQAWVMPTFTDPDYFNACATNSPNPYTLLGLLVNVPDAFPGYQYARTGNAYAGFFANDILALGGAYNYTIIPHGVDTFEGQAYKLSAEYLETKLADSMKAGHHYKVQFYVNFASYEAYDSLSNGVAIDQIGAYFSTTQVNNYPAYYLTYTPSVKSPPGQFIMDTVNWTRISGIYVANGSEQWLTLGRFYDSSTFSIKRGITLDTVKPPTGPYYLGNYNVDLAYYYVDDICVLDLDHPIATVRDTVLCPSSFPITLAGMYHIDSSGSPDSIHHVWNTGQTTTSITANDTGTYWMTTTGECSIFVDTIHVSVYPSPTLNIGNDTNYCPGSTAILSANHPYISYMWSTGSTDSSISVTQAGTYMLTIRDTCRTQTSSINITFNPTPAPTGGDTSICQDVIAPVINITGDSVLWYTTADSQGTPIQPVIATNTPGLITLYVSQSGICGESAISPIEITIDTLPEIFLPEDTAFCTGGSLLITAETQGVQQYRWNTGDTTCCVSVTTAGVYTIMGTGFCGATWDSIRVKEENCNNCLWVPSAFTPNGDAKNDVFHVVSVCPIGNYQIVIVNRWGQTVFESYNIEQGWDGTFNGVPSEIGTYFYYIVAYPALGGSQQIEMKGDITLIR